MLQQALTMALHSVPDENGNLDGIFLRLARTRAAVPVLMGAHTQTTKKIAGRWERRGVVCENGEFRTESREIYPKVAQESYFSPPRLPLCFQFRHSMLQDGGGGPQWRRDGGAG